MKVSATIFIAYTASDLLLTFLTPQELLAFLIGHLLLTVGGVEAEEYLRPSKQTQTFLKPPRYDRSYLLAPAAAETSELSALVR